MSVDLKKKKHSSALKRNAESLAVDWGSLRKSLHPVLSREICFLSTKRQKKKCCFQHLWTFCLIYRVFFKTCTRQKQRQGSWKLDLNTKKKKKSVKPSVMLYVRGYQRDETEYKTDCWKIQFLWTDFPPKNGNTQISTHKTARNWLIVVFLQYRLTRIMLHSGLMGEL